MVTLSQYLQENLNANQQLFVIKAFERILNIDSVFYDESTSPSVRFLYLKELFSIFAELETIPALYDSPNYKGKNIPAVEDIKQMIRFMRNVIAHFPLFDTYEEACISIDLASSMWFRGGTSTIARFISIEKESIPIELVYVDDSKIDFVISYECLKRGPTEDVYLHEILSEQNVAKCIKILFETHVST